MGECDCDEMGSHLDLGWCETCYLQQQALIALTINYYISNYITESSMIIGSKSSPLIEDNPSSKVNRSSKRSSRQRDSNEYEYHKVANPFVGKHSDFLPSGLLQQINNLDYLTPNHLQKISWQQAVFVPRRSSVFTKHLQAMQKAARQQQNRVGPVKRAKVCFEDEMEEQNSISLDQKCEQDLVSQVSRQRWALQPMQFEMDGLESLESVQEQGPMHYYSMTDLGRLAEPPDWDDYFNQ